MIDVGAKNVCFACDECGIHEQVRLNAECRSPVSSEKISSTTIVVATKSETSSGLEGTAKTLLSRSLPKQTRAGARQVVHTGGRCGVRPFRSTAMVTTGFMGRTFVGIGKETSLFSAPTLSIHRTLPTRHSLSGCQTKRCAGTAAFPPKGMDTAKSSTTGGRLIRRWFDANHSKGTRGSAYHIPG